MQPMPIGRKNPSTIGLHIHAYGAKKTKKTQERLKI